MFITDDIQHVGVNDENIDLFEGQFSVKHGMSYNSYLITDEKIAVCDTVDSRLEEDWLFNIHCVSRGVEPDYLIIHHMEPDHSSNIASFMETYKNAKIVSNPMAFNMMKQFFGTDYSDRQIIVRENDTLKLGKHVLKFVMAPMVHWPEVMVSYDCYDKVLFSADGFGKFGTLDTEEDWACEARRYYFGIVGKYGKQVQSLLKKVSDFDIKIICPLHGPVLKDNLSYYTELYDTWSSYRPETDGVLIAYTSVYGHTKDAVNYLAEKLTAKGCKNVVVTDLAHSDMAENVEDAFRYKNLILATTTYNGGVFPYMQEFINKLTERDFQNRTVGFIENGSWQPFAAKTMKKMLENSKNITFLNTQTTIKSALNDESRAQLNAMSDELCTNKRGGIEKNILVV